MKKGWQTKKIGDVCSLRTGGTPSKAKPEYFGGEIRWLVSGDINQGEIFECEGRITEAGMKASNAKLLPVNSVMIALNGQGKTRGTVALLRTPATCNQSLVSIYPNETDKLLPEFLYANLHGRYQELRQMTGDSGNDRRGLNMILIKGIEIPIAPLPEQHRIVGILDEAFEGIARATANAEQNLRNARALFESGLDSAVTGKLTLGWRRKHAETENASADLAVELVERRKRWTGPGKYREPDAPTTLKPIDIPESWVLASPEQIASHIVDCPHSTPKWAESGVLCLRTTNFKPGFLDLASVRFVSQQTYKERIVRLEPKSGDVLYSREGGILGIACMIPEQLKTCLGQRMMLLRANPALVLPEYFTAVLNSTLILSEVRRLTSGAASPHLNICDIRKFPIPLPPITEQRQIVSQLDALAAEAQRLESIYQQKLAALGELKKSLLHQAFSGNL